MSDQSGNDTGPKAAIALAVDYLESHRQELSGDREQALDQKIEEWEARQADLDENDPLYRVAEERIREYKSKREQLQTDLEDLERELLEVVSEEFLATGDWMDERLLRALNLIFFDKYSDSLVVQRHVLGEGTDFEDDDLYEVSRAVRKLAADELAT